MNFRKCLLLTFICYLFCCGSALAQIKLPVGFRCVLGQNHPNESYFTNGSVTFKTYPWGHEGMAGQEVADAIQEAYNKKIKFSKTKDNLYWATGKVDEGYVYIIIAQDALQFTIKSKTNDANFSDYCIWMLKEIRREIATTNELSLTDFQGESCFGINEK